MDGAFRFLCQAESRRLLLLMAIIVALVLAVQYFELPSIEVFTSLFALGNNSSSPNGESSLPSKMVGTVVHENDSNSTRRNAVNETGNGARASNMGKETAEGEEDISPKNGYLSKSNGGLNDYFGLFSNGSSPDNLVGVNKSSTLENGENIVSVPPELGIAPAQGFYLKQDVIKDNISSSSSGSSDFDVAPSASPLINSPSIPSDARARSSLASANSSMSLGKSAEDVLNDNKNLISLSNSSLSGNVSSENSIPAQKKGTRRKPEKKSRKPPEVVVSISEMNDLLLQSHASPHSTVPKWSSKVDQELMSAKSRILSASATKNASELFLPLYRNSSMFKRSYELMENMLKVYVYQDGEKPIFHQAILDGIYASEGWFMKLLEVNKKFTTKDPQKAHLFYLPFSSRMLELTLYVRNSHSRNNLIQYVKTYVDSIATKYPFWNRTGGADHFLASCHDWAPAETRGRLLNCIRALCNADIDVGFTIGKDVSLPETYVHTAQNPLKNLGGYPPSQRHILAFFAGNMHGYVRPILLKYWGNKDPDMKIFGPMPHTKGNSNYLEHMKSSRFCICAKGHEVNSPRVVEAIMFECVPVIISDNFVPPFFEVLNWESFAVFVLEKDIPNLKTILLSISEERYVEMHKRVKKVQKHFLWHSNPVKYDIFHMILHSVWYNRVFQIRAR
ncbi:hypothetical protein SLEP1_g15730 [Rubroshorea leprosula]|uniref:Exostosin GT47 domain-containing protein n=1 Tax=Rubroshorea leprosula TaxID=152421 RepID=A0AAV5IXI1_9ROSI|nr:hypothetical protein SLEP1_g15730 [Rubroshorea leprosula]